MVAVAIAAVVVVVAVVDCPIMSATVVADAFDAATIGPIAAFAVIVAAFVVESEATCLLDISSYAAALGQVDTNKLFPCVPAVLAANVPTTP